MGLLVLLFLLCCFQVARATHTDGMPHGCNSTGCRQCIFDFVDANADGTITVEEMDAFNITERCGTNMYWNILSIVNGTETYDVLNGTWIVERCDLGVDGFPEGKDGVITQYDFMGPFSCMRIAAMRVLICRQCWQCQAYQLSLQPTMAPSEAPTDAPSEAPTDAPSEAPTLPPTDAPTIEAPT